ncbi:IAA-amino acid hydrolase ILR1-like 4 isoform X2 [Lathyrus oleraceus]|nr:IAA-amino acid hydrolase ILR1-like 4 isoform X2 [Pisum sativum]
MSCSSFKFNTFQFCIIIFILHVFAATPILSDNSSFNNFLDIAKSPEVFYWMVSIRRKLHENPELGYQEFETSKLIRSELDKMGIPYKHPVAITGVIGFIGTGFSPFVAIRAVMDALPMQEMVEWEHKSKVDGKMHACGHDAHVAMLLAAAKILKHHEKEIQGTVVLVFQPAEEGSGGSKKIVESGVLENVTAIFGLHVVPELPIGEVASRSGPLLAGSGRFEAKISGKVVTVAKFQGGSAFNVIPDYVTIGGTYRDFSKQSFNHLRQRIEQIIVGQAAVHRCNATVDFLDEVKPSYPPTINDGDLHEHFVNVAVNMLGVSKVNSAVTPYIAAEDFAFYQEIMPGYFFMVGVKNAKHKPSESFLHSPYLQINEDGFPYGAALHASLAASYLQKHQQNRPGAADSKYHDEI